jgi:hypothetical protein
MIFTVNAILASIVTLLSIVVTCLSAVRFVRTSWAKDRWGVPLSLCLFMGCLFVSMFFVTLLPYMYEIARTHA